MIPCPQFHTLAPEVQSKLLAEGFNNLAELRFLFDKTKNTWGGGWLSSGSARLRRAWSAVRLYDSHSEQDRSKVALTDLGYDAGELRDVKQAFW